MVKNEISKMITNHTRLPPVHTKLERSRDSSVGIATGYGLNDRGVGVRVPVGTLRHVIQTDSGAHPAYPMGTGGDFPGVKRQGREADHSPPACAEAKKVWICITTPPYASMA
jgi:hypothetical protein